VASSLVQTGHQFHVHSVEIVAGPIGSTDGLRRVKFPNQFDEFGSLVSLERLQDETNWEYRRRIQDVMVNLANASYRGMVNGITRELGLSLYDSLIINPKINMNTGRFLAPDPYIKFDGVYLYLYSDYANGVLDWAIDRYEPGGNYEHVGRLASMVNTTSFFEAHVVEGIDLYDKSMTILNQSNRNIVRFERIPSSTKFALKNTRIVPGTLFFANRTTFKTEVESADLVLQKGQYYVDYHKGIVVVFSVPTSGEIARYQYVKYPFSATASPVILHDINKDSFKVKMFSQVLQDDGGYEHGKVTELGVDIINELMSVIPMYWGT